MFSLNSPDATRLPSCLLETTQVHFSPCQHFHYLICFSPHRAHIECADMERIWPFAGCRPCSFTPSSCQAGDVTGYTAWLPAPTVLRILLLVFRFCSILTEGCSSNANPDTTGSPRSPPFPADLGRGLPRWYHLDGGAHPQDHRSSTKKSVCRPLRRFEASRLVFRMILTCKDFLQGLFYLFVYFHKWPF